MFKAVALTIPSTALSVAINVLIHEHSGLKAVLTPGDEAWNTFSGFTFVLGFLIVFRAQQAYSRWWEGGTLLQELRGEWFNAYSCLLAFCNDAQEMRTEVEEFQNVLVRLFSLLYGCALEQVCTLEEKKFELIDIEGLGSDSIEFLMSSPDRCEVTLQWIQRLIVDKTDRDVVKIAPPILSRVFHELGNGIVNLKNARKITDFPIPFPLSQMITLMLLLHGMVMPVLCAVRVEQVHWVAVINFIVVWAYWMVNYIALELEMPFGDDTNDLPLYQMQRDMNESLSRLIDDRAQQVPSFDNTRANDVRLSRTLVDFNDDLAPSKMVHRSSIRSGDPRGSFQERAARARLSFQEQQRTAFATMVSAHSLSVQTMMRLPRMISKGSSRPSSGTCTASKASPAASGDLEHELEPVEMNDNQPQTQRMPSRESPVPQLTPLGDIVGPCLGASSPSPPEPSSMPTVADLGSGIRGAAATAAGSDSPRAGSGGSGFGEPEIWTADADMHSAKEQGVRTLALVPALASSSTGRGNRRTPVTAFGMANPAGAEALATEVAVAAAAAKRLAAAGTAAEEAAAVPNGWACTV